MRYITTQHEINEVFEPPGEDCAGEWEFVSSQIHYAPIQDPYSSEQSLIREVQVFVTWRTK